ncbi:MAG: extensin family protein [Deltaproteobacteria bacterium]|nr:extensin family protein [Deltaproteobacteria bacterium]
MSRAVLAILVVALVGTADAGRRRKHRRHVTSTVEATGTAAYRYGGMSAEQCEAELVAREIPVTAEPSPGVLAGVRLTGPLHGVTFRTRHSKETRAPSRWEVADCRLVLALDDMAAVLEPHGIVEVVHYSMYRPPSKSWPEDKLATRHAGALALDAGQFIDRDGVIYDVDADFSGRIGARTCGPKAKPRKPTAKALKLRALLCETVARRVFNVVLTPNHDRPHKNHFHLEVTPGVTWFIVD